MHCICILINTVSTLIDMFLTWPTKVKGVKVSEATISVLVNYKTDVPIAYTICDGQSAIKSSVVRQPAQMMSYRRTQLDSRDSDGAPKASNKRAIVIEVRSYKIEVLNRALECNFRI